MQFSELVIKRRSVRSFTDRKLTKSELEYILNAGINAPSARNMQSWHFYCLLGEETKKLQGACADWVLTAPVVLVVCGTGDEIANQFGEWTRKFTVYDTNLAMQNMMLAACDIGLGSCMIGMYDEAMVKQAVGIPKDRSVVALLPIGEPKVVPETRGRKPLEEAVTFIGEI